MQLRSIVVFAGIAVFAAMPANSVPLVAGGNPLSGTIVAAEPNLAGNIVADTLDPLSITNGDGTLNAMVQSRVVQAIDGTYDFYWRITDLSFQPARGFDGGTPLIRTLRIGNFGTSVIGDNANYRTDGLGNVGPDDALVLGPNSNFVNFRFFNGLMPGQSSYFMFLDTNATNYSRSAALDLTSGGSISGMISTFAPGGVPEPTTWAMMILGFGGIASVMRRRRTAVRFA